MKTTILDVLGVICLALFAYSLWAPACLLVIGVSALAVSWVEARATTPSSRGGDS